MQCLDLLEQPIVYQSQRQRGPQVEAHDRYRDLGCY